mgnify:CR=1 FL=1
MKSKKKILIVVAIVLIIIIALAGTVAGMVMTGKVAITTRQKLAKGFSDIGNKISTTDLEKNFKEQEKLYQTPFESETTITGKVNKIELSNSTGLEEILNEVENVVNNTKITNTLKADLKNNIINEKISVNMSDIVEEISADVEYNNDRISLKSKELNDKYITFTKNEVETNNQYADFAELFKMFEGICQKETAGIYLTESDKAYFARNYGGILSEYITDDMLKEEKASIILDGQTKQCDNINFTLDKNQIAEIVGKYLKKLEEDQEGKQIIISKIKSVVNTFEEENLQEIIDDLKYELMYLEEGTTMKVSLYCTMFKTYGFNIDFYSGENYILNLILGEKEDNLKISTTEGEILNAIISEDKMKIAITGEENTAIVEMKTNDTQKIITIEINDLQDNVKIAGTLTNEQITKTENENKSNNTIQIALQVEDNNIDITLNIDTNLRYVNSIEKTEYTDTNSINIVTAEQSEIQQYITEIQNNTITLMQKATQNSKLIQEIYTLMIGGKKVQPQNQPVQEFNSMFKNYTGIQRGSAMKTLLQQIATSNSTNEIHKISVSIVEDGNPLLNVTKNVDEINSSINSIKDEKEYEVLGTSVDAEGYITGIEIRQK